MRELSTMSTDKLNELLNNYSDVLCDLDADLTGPTILQLGGKIKEIIVELRERDLIGLYDERRHHTRRRQLEQATGNGRSVRYFIQHYDGGCDEVNKAEFDETSGAVTTVEHTVHANGVNQTCHTVFNNC